MLHSGTSGMLPLDDLIDSKPTVHMYRILVAVPRWLQGVTCWW